MMGYMKINKLVEHKIGKHNDVGGSPQIRGYFHQTAYNSFNLFNRKLQATVPVVHHFPQYLS